MRITDFPILSEIREEYTKLRQEGSSREEAVAKLKSSYRHEIGSGAEDDGLLFRVGLADAQYAWKELSLEEAEQGLAALNQLEQTYHEITPGDFIRRRERYAKAPMPERAKLKKTNRFRCSWVIGDTFAYQLQGKDALEFGLSGRYVLFRKVSEVEDAHGAVMPVVTVSMWDDAPLPATPEEFQRLPFLKLDNGRAHTPKDLFIYRTEMLIDNKKMLERLNLQYVGNFPNIAMPKDEAVIEYVGYMKKLALNRIDISCCNYWRNHHFYENMK